MKNYYVIFLSFLCHSLLIGQEHDRAIQFPDIPGYKTLKCDLHIHTVFSDGKVWPNIRVQEAIKDGLDAISLTEHLEYQPHKKDLPHPDRNRAHDIAYKSAKDSELIVIRGAEITRKMPPGHANAIFITDANKLLLDDPMDVFKEARKQGAFIFWNHPNWYSQEKDGIAKLHEMHKKLIKKGLLHGIEVANETTYSDEALQIALDNDLTIMGTSDIHGLIDWEFDVHEGGHRPITLVFGKEKSEEAIKEGLMNRKTVVWFNDILIGEEAYLVPLIKACVTVEKAAYIGQTQVARITLKNPYDANLILSNESEYTLHEHSDIVIVKAHETTEIQVKTLKKLKEVTLKFEVLNATTAPNKHPIIEWKIPLK